MKIDKKTIVAIVLCIAAVVVVATQLKSGFAPGKPAVTNLAANSAAAAPLSTAKASTAPTVDEGALKAATYSNFIETVRESDLDFEAKSFRNPMTPLVSESSGKGSGNKAGKVMSLKAPVVGLTDALALGYTIEGIVWDEASPLAIVNDQVVGVGDRIDDLALVKEITPRRVTFTRKGREYFLEFREE